MSDPLGDGADLLRRLGSDWLGLPAPALTRDVAPDWLINLPSINLAYPIPPPHPMPNWPRARKRRPRPRNWRIRSECWS